jgi:hypothetical protein
VVVDIGPKNTTNEDIHRNERRNTLINSLTEPALSEISVYATLIKSRGRLLFLKMSELKWAEAEKDYIRRHFGRETHFVRDAMSNFQRDLNKDEFI